MLNILKYFIMKGFTIIKIFFTLIIISFHSMVFSQENDFEPSGSTVNDGQDIQIRMKTKSYFDAPFIGKVDMYQTTFLAKKQRNTQNTLGIQKKIFGFIANLISDISDTTGHLIMANGKQWGYNTDKKEYWSPEYFDEENKDDDDGSKEFSFTIGDGENDIIYVSRVGYDDLESIHGFRAKKYTTTFETLESKIEIDEWAVRELPLLRLADSLNKEILLMIDSPDSVISASTYGAGLSNNEMVLGSSNLDSIMLVYDIVPITGEIIKGDVRLRGKKNDESDVTFGTEIIELYAQNYNSKRFSIGIEYNLKDKN